MTDRKRSLRIPLAALVWAVLVMFSALLLVGLYYFWYRSGQQTNEAAQQRAKNAARDGVMAVYTYSADTIDRDIASAQSHLTGDFLSQYQEYLHSPAPSEAKANAVKTAANVIGTAVMGEMQPDSADVLVFMNQTTTSAQNPATSLASRSIVVTLAKVDDKWLISSMRPA